MNKYETLSVDVIPRSTKKLQLDPKKWANNKLNLYRICCLADGCEEIAKAAKIDKDLK